MREPLPSSHAYERLIRRFETIVFFEEADRSLIRSLPLRPVQIQAGQDFIFEGDKPDHCCLLVEGVLHRSKILHNGARQIVAFHLPGDIPDLQSLYLRTMDHSLGALDQAEVAFIPHAALYEAFERRPRLVAAAWRETLIDGAIFREWVLNLGARPARARIAHLICELFLRFRAIGLATANGFEMPWSQAQIGEAAGISAVHVNRTLQDLRAGHLLGNDTRKIEILDWPGLQRVAEFDPTYLHLAPLPTTASVGQRSNKD